MNHENHELRAQGCGCLGLLLIAAIGAVAVWIIVNTPAPFNHCPCHL